jgi:hypothetical protein
MNKKITLLVLAVVLAAMALVFFTQTGGRLSPGGENAAGGRDGGVMPLGGQEGNETGLPPIEPQLADGAPKAVTVTTSPDGRISRVEDQPPAAQEAQASNSSEEESASRRSATDRESAGTASLKTPSLTPWELAPEPASKPAPKAAEKEPPQAAPKAAAPEKIVAEQRPRTAEIKPLPEEDLSESAAHSLKAVSLHFAGKNMKLRLEANNAFPCKSFVLTGPDRLVIDLPGKWSGMAVPQIPQNNLVKNARLGKQPAGPRLVLDLARPLRGHTVQRSYNVVEVLLQQ